MKNGVINPSIHGWIDKFFLLPGGTDDTVENTSRFYLEVRNTGFIYGHIVSFFTAKQIDADGWLDDEKSKLALLIVLYRLHRQIRPDDSVQDFLSAAVSYYREMSPKGFDFIRRIIPGGNPASQLEDIISDRVQTNANIVSKHFSHIVTNALLFLDVLGYQKFLLHESIPHKYLKRSEELIISVISVALQVKTRKSSYDDLLIRLLDSSLRYGSFSEVSKRRPEVLPLDYFETDLEKFYLLDLAGLALWSDGMVEANESGFLFELGKSLGIGETHTAEALKSMNAFISDNHKKISYFRYSNPVKHFYDKMYENVAVLVSRNRVRLVKEISQSGELVKLLAASTTRDLDEKEKKKVRKQLLDICKSIPSLTIFLLPGGSLLLPILIKFIPQMLPSAFNENSESE